MCEEHAEEDGGGRCLLKGAAKDKPPTQAAFPDSGDAVLPVWSWHQRDVLFLEEFQLPGISPSSRTFDSAAHICVFVNTICQVAVKQHVKVFSLSVPSRIRDKLVANSKHCSCSLRGLWECITNGWQTGFDMIYSPIASASYNSGLVLFATLTTATINRTFIGKTNCIFLWRIEIKTIGENPHSWPAFPKNPKGLIALSFVRIVDGPPPHEDALCGRQRSFQTEWSGVLSFNECLKEGAIHQTVFGTIRSKLNK